MQLQSTLRPIVPVSVFIGLAYSILLLCGCSEKPALTPLNSSAVIMAFGNSLTHGTGASKGNNYPSTLGKMTGLQVINAGIPGEISKDGLKRLPGLLDEHEPRLVVLIHGGNDLLRKHDHEETRKNLSEMIRVTRERDISVVMLGVPDPGLFLSSADFYSELATEWAVPIDEDILADVLADRQLKSDYIHPNDRGYRLIAEATYRLLKQHGAL